MKGWIKSLDNWIYQNRALSLLLTVMLTLALVGLANWLSGSDLFRQFFFPKICDKSFPATCDPLDWKDLFQAAILILGLPVAFGIGVIETSEIRLIMRVRTIILKNSNNCSYGLLV
jgi:hypothetical protein